MKFERLYLFDVFKMIGVLGITFAHTLVFEYQPQPEGLVEEKLFYPDGPRPPSLFNRIMFYFLTTGGHFVIQNGAIRMYLNYSRIQKNGKKYLFNFLFSDIVYGILLLIYHFIFVVILANSGLLYRLIRGNKVIWGKEMLRELASQDVVVLFGLSTLSMKFVYFILFGVLDITRIRPINVKLILVCCGSIVLFLTPLVRTWLGKMDREMLKEEKYFQLIVVHCFCGNNFSFFPFFGYCFFGACLGYSFYIQELFIDMLKFYGFISSILFASGMMGLYYICGKYLLYSGLYNDYSFKGMFMKSCMHSSQVGVILMILLGVYRMLILFDEGKICSRKCLRKFLFFAQVITRISLSIFLLEYILKSLISIPFKMLFPYYQNSISKCLLFSLTNSSGWVAIAFLWRKIGWIGSFEWIYVKIVGFITGKVSTKLESIQILENYQIRVEDRKKEKYSFD